ncbi:MAG: RES family NAD+ phosphorylase [Bacteroidota bacterium]
MLVYRLCRTKYANDLSGEGSRLRGGRWNNKKTSCVYTSSSRSLALLEYTVNVNIDDIPRSLSLITIDIKEHPIFCPKILQLPGDWKDHPTPSSTKEYGTALLIKNEYAILRFPSVIIPQEYNYILNSGHTLSNSFEVVEVSDFSYDTRIKLA